MISRGKKRKAPAPAPAHLETVKTPEPTSLYSIRSTLKILLQANHAIPQRTRTRQQIGSISFQPSVGCPPPRRLSRLPLLWSAHTDDKFIRVLTDPTDVLFPATIDWIIDSFVQRLATHRRLFFAAKAECSQEPVGLVCHAEIRATQVQYKIDDASRPCEVTKCDNNKKLREVKFHLVMENGCKRIHAKSHTRTKWGYALAAMPREPELGQDFNFF